MAVRALYSIRILARTNTEVASLTTVAVGSTLPFADWAVPLQYPLAVAMITITEQSNIIKTPNVQELDTREPCGDTGVRRQRLCLRTVKQKLRMSPCVSQVKAYAATTLTSIQNNDRSPSPRWVVPTLNAISLKRKKKGCSDSNVRVCARRG